MFAEKKQLRNSGQKRIFIGLAGFLLAFLAGFVVVLLKWWVLAPAPTPVSPARIIEDNQQQSFKHDVVNLPGTAEELDFVQFVSATDGWAGNHQGTMFRTHDGGNKWERLDSKLQGYLTSMHFSSESSGWLLLQHYEDTLDKTTYQASIQHTDDGGRSWSPQVSLNSVELVRMSFVSATEGWAVGTRFRKLPDTLTAEILLLRTVDGGVTWTDESDALNAALAGCSRQPRQLAGAIFADRAKALTVISEAGWVLDTADEGVSWQCLGQFATGSLRPGMIVRAPDGATRVVAAAGGNHGTASLIGKRDENGSWSGRSLSDVFIKDAIYLAGKELLACGSMVTSGGQPSGVRKEGVLLRSTDDGASWSVIYRSSEINALNALASTSSGQIFAVGANGSLVRYTR